MLGPIYWAISWILLQWHALWNTVLGGSEFLATTWDWVLAIVFLVLTVRGILFPVFVKQIKSQRAMQALAPQIKELQAKHKGDRETLQKEMMQLYKTEKANPLMGCLPMLVQLPVMWSLFHVLRHVKPTMPLHLQTLYGWTVGQFESASHAKLFGAPIAASFRSSPADLASLHASGTTVRIVAGVLIAIMIATTYLTSRQMILKTGWAEDPQQKMIQRLMLYGIPVSLLISGGLFPIGVVIYWTTTNLFSLGQQFWVLRKYPPPPNASKLAKAGTGPKAPTKTAGSTPKVAAPKVGAKPITAKPGTKAVPAKAPAKTASSKATPAKAASAKDAPTKDTPAKATPAKAPPAKAAPAKAAPVKKTPAKNGVASTSAADGRSLAPKPGAKPVKKSSNPAKRVSG